MRTVERNIGNIKAGSITDGIFVQTYGNIIAYYKGVKIIVPFENSETISYEQIKNGLVEKGEYKIAIDMINKERRRALKEYNEPVVGNADDSGSTGRAYSKFAERNDFIRLTADLIQTGVDAFLGTQEKRYLEEAERVMKDIKENEEFSYEITSFGSAMGRDLIEKTNVKLAKKGITSEFWMENLRELYISNWDEEEGERQFSLFKKVLESEM